jgi:hypothetical protein
VSLKFYAPIRYVRAVPHLTFQNNPQQQELEARLKQQSCFLLKIKFRSYAFRRDRLAARITPEGVTAERAEQKYLISSRENASGKIYLKKHERVLMQREEKTVKVFFADLK